MAETYGDYFTGLGRSIGQGVTFGFGDEIEAGIRALGAGTYDEEVAKIRADLEKFRETNPVSAYGSEIAASLPTGLGLGALALRAGVRGIGKIGAAEGALYGAGVGEDAEGRAVSAAIGAPLGAAGAVVGEKVVRGIAPMIGKFMKRGSGSEIRGATDIQLDAAEQPRATIFDVETGVTSPLEKTVGEPGSRVKYDETGTVELIKPASDLGPGGINPVTKDPLLGPFTADYSPIENALANAERVMNASPTKGLTGEQYLARLVEQPSVTKTEMNTSGLASFLSRPENKRRKIPVAEVQQYMKENAPNIEVFKYTGDQNNVSYRETQRFMDENAYSEVGYGEITINNRNAHPATSGHMLSHYRDQLGNFAHVRYSDHNDASGGISRVIEENQFDLLQSLLSQERGGALSRISTVKLTPDKVADYDARIEKLRATPEYPAVLQTGDDLTTAAARLSNAETRRNEVARQQEDVRRAINEKMESAIGNFIVAGELPLPNTRARSQTEIQAQIQNATPDFIQGVMQTSLRELFDRRVQPSVDELGQMITRAVNSTPEQLVDEILEAAKKRGKDPLSKYPPDAVTGRPGGPGARMRLNIARQYATPIEQATLRASQEIEKKGISSYLMALVESNQAVPSKSYPALRNQADPAKVQLYEDRAAFIRNVMAETMSGRMLRATSQIIEQDRAELADLSAEFVKRRNEVEAQKKVRSRASLEFESSTKKLLRKNKEITGDVDSTPSADTKGFLEYAYKTNFVSQQGIVDEVDPARRAQLVPNQPFDTPLQAARHNILMAINDAVDEGVERVYFPDYRDLAELREVNPEGFFKTVYKDAPEKVIKELKQKFPNLKTGRISPNDFVANHLSEIGGEAAVTQPVLYLDISRDSIKRLGIPRRYAKGGQVDLRSGIGNMFRLYS